MCNNQQNPYEIEVNAFPQTKITAAFTSNMASLYS